MELFQGSAFLPSGRRTTGHIKVTPFEVHFDAGDETFSLPLRGLTIRTGGASDRLIFFEHPSMAGTSIYTSDAKILDVPTFVNDPALQTHLTRIRGESRRKLAGIGVILAVLALLIVGLFAARGPMVALVARQIPPDMERKLGEAGMRQILLTAKTEPNPVITAPIQQILKEVSRGAPASPYKFELTVVRDDAVNAFALPGGYLVVNTGLIEKAKSSDEIAGVMAHEIAHVTERHSVRQIISSLGIFILVQAVFGDISGLVAMAAESGAELVVLRFSRDAEREADEEGVATLRRAGLTANGMVSFFDTLKKEEGAASAIPAFLSTHPATDERIAHLKTVVQKDGARSLGKTVDIRPAQKALLD